MDKRKIIYSVIGAAAFIVGGIVSRQKALETAETVEGFFSKDSKKPVEAPIE